LRFESKRERIAESVIFPRFIKPGETLIPLSGFRIQPEMIRAKTDVVGNFILLEEYHRSAGEYLAKLLRMELALL